MLYCLAKFPKKKYLAIEFRLPNWSVLPIALAIASLTSIGIYRLNHWAEDNNQQRILLINLKQEVSRLNSLEWETLIKQTIDDNLRQELKEHQVELKKILDKLDSPYFHSRSLIFRQDSQHEQLHIVLKLYQRYDKQHEKNSRLIAAGKFKFLSDREIEDINFVYDRLFIEINKLDNFYLIRQHQARIIADLGTTIALILAAATLGYLFWWFNHQLFIKNQNLALAIDNLQQVQEQLIQQEKMVALGQLVAGIAHEINTPLGAIKASASNIDRALQEVLTELPHLDSYLSPEEKNYFLNLITNISVCKISRTSSENRALKRQTIEQLEKYQINHPRIIADRFIDMNIDTEIQIWLPLLRHPKIDWILQLAYNLTRLLANNHTILTAVERASKVVFALKSYARYDLDGEKKFAKIVDGIETVLELYHNQIKHNIEIIRNYQTNIEIWCYPDELIQVWTNLIHNSIQAMNYRGSLEIRTLEDINEVKVEISDSGAGIPPEIQSRIFDPFYTTKPAGEGSGLGLHISQKIIEKHQGRIEVVSQPGKTKFSVCLPINNR
jgi:signal transduction histidine kinase